MSNIILFGDISIQFFWLNFWKMKTQNEKLKRMFHLTENGQTFSKETAVYFVPSSRALERAGHSQNTSSNFGVGVILPLTNSVDFAA